MIDEKRIVRIAKAIMANGEAETSEDFDPYKFFSETVKTADWSGKGFYVSDQNDDEITWTFKADDLESCYVLFGESDGDWGYTVVIGGDEEEQQFFDDIRKAWEQLDKRMDGFAQKMTDFVEEENEGEEVVEEETSPLGNCSIREVEDEGEFGGNDNIFSLMYDAQDTVTYEASFSPSADADAADVKDSLKYIKEDLSNGMPVFRKRGSNVIRFQAVNKRDIDYAKSVIQNAGWILG